MNDSSFFSNKDCQYFPCHETQDTENFNCLFCYCPLYALGDKCGGNFSYTDNGTKDCSKCMVPHKRDSAYYIWSKFDEIKAIAGRKNKEMNIVCLDMEGIVFPEIWIAVSRATGIDELKLTTRDVPVYSQLMDNRLRILREHNLGIKDIQDVIAGIDPLPGAREFMEEIREIVPVVILSDTFEQFAQPIKKKLGYPTILCNTLEIDADGMIAGYHMRCEKSKLTTVRGFQSMGYETIAVGDSYNDLEMIMASKSGFLLNPPETILKDHPEIPAFYNYADLLDAIKKAL